MQIQRRLTNRLSSMKVSLGQHSSLYLNVMINVGEPLINPGGATIDTETVDRSNETDVPAIQSTLATTPQLECSEATDGGRNAQHSPGDVRDTTEAHAPLLNLPAPKAPEIIGGDAQSSASIDV